MGRRSGGAETSGVGSLIGEAGVCAASITDKIVEGLIVLLETLLNSAPLLLCVNPLLYTELVR